MMFSLSLDPEALLCVAPSCRASSATRPFADGVPIDRGLVAEEETFLAEKVYGGDCLQIPTKPAGDSDLKPATIPT